MSSISWREALEAVLDRLIAGAGADSPRVAVVGIGQELRGDDAAGCFVATCLQTQLADHGGLLVLDGGPAPESQTGLLRRFRPALVIFVDAAQMGDPPGSVRWLPWEKTVGTSNSTHALPINMLARYLNATLGCEIFLIGIQPAAMTLGAPLTRAVQCAAGAVTEALLLALAKLRRQNEMPQHN